MKFNVRTYKAQESQPDYPAEMKRARDLVVISMATMMQLHGIRKIDLDVVMVGPDMVPSPSMSVVEPDGTPRSLVLVRNKIARSVIDMLLTYGVLSLEIEPTEKETSAMDRRWKHLVEGDEDERGNQ